MVEKSSTLEGERVGKASPRVQRTRQLAQGMCSIDVPIRGLAFGCTSR